MGSPQQDCSAGDSFHSCIRPGSPRAAPGHHGAQSCPLTLLDQLAADEDETIRLQVALHRNTARSTREKLRDNSSDRVRELVRRMAQSGGMKGVSAHGRISTAHWVLPQVEDRADRVRPAIRAGRGVISDITVSCDDEQNGLRTRGHRWQNGRTFCSSSPTSIASTISAATAIQSSRRRISIRSPRAARASSASTWRRRSACPTARP